MKKLLAIIITVMVIFNIYNLFTYYEKECEVISCNGNIVRCIDIHDNVWQFETTTHYSVGDVVLLKMTTHQTDSILDDEIVEINLK